MTHESFEKVVHKIAREYIGKINPRTGKIFTKEERFHIAKARAGEIATMHHKSATHISEHVKKQHGSLPPVMKPWTLM